MRVNSFLTIIGLMGLVMLVSARTAEATVQTRTVSLCDGIQVEVTGVSSRLGKRALLSAINYAATGARDSCKILSDKNSKSQLRVINSQAGQAAVRVGLDLQYLMPRIVRLSQMTSGAFDPMAWSRRKRATYKDILFDSSRRELMLKKKGESLSFRGLLKGYLADRITARLRKKGINRYFVDVGGTAKKSSGQGINSSWMTGIQDPHNRAEDSICRVALVNRAMSTAAAYSWDQRAGTYPGAAAFASVTVITTNAMTAEALANAAMVSGEQGKALIRRIRGASAVFVDHHGRLSIVGSLPAACMR